MSRPVEVLRRGVFAIRDQLLAVAGQSERSIMLGIILLASAVSAATGFVLAQYYAVDVFTSLLFVPQDCWLDWGTQIGRHCFNDYLLMADMGMRPNPWEPYPLFLPWADYRWSQNNYPAAGMVPNLLFAVPAHWLGAPRLGLIGYLSVLTAAVLAPAVWAARGARGVERVVVFVVLGAAAIPAWAAIDRGNSVGFLAPIGLVFLVALRRQRWALVALMVVLAALIKPQFAILAVALFAARQWRWGSIALGGAVIFNLAAYLLWPRDFPDTITRSIGGTLGYGSGQAIVTELNVSFSNGLLPIAHAIANLAGPGTIPERLLHDPRLMAECGVVILLAVVVCVLSLGRRIPPVMVGIALLATASLFPALSYRYYLVFALPVAALMARDPDGPPGTGVFDRLAGLGDRRRAVGICVGVAAALSIAQIALPSPPIQSLIVGQMGEIGFIGSTPIVATTVGLAPLLWLIACAAIIASYMRRPAISSRSHQTHASAGIPPADRVPRLLDPSPK